jgi:hypothetical protein
LVSHRKVLASSWQQSESEHASLTITQSKSLPAFSSPLSTSFCGIWPNALI